jgi:hypothetical protein
LIKPGFSRIPFKLVEHSTSGLMSTLRIMFPVIHAVSWLSLISHGFVIGDFSVSTLQSALYLIVFGWINFMIWCFHLVTNIRTLPSTESDSRLWITDGTERQTVNIDCLTLLSVPSKGFIREAFWLEFEVRWEYISGCGSFGSVSVNNRLKKLIFWIKGNLPYIWLKFKTFRNRLGFNHLSTLPGILAAIWHYGATRMNASNHVERLTVILILSVSVID